jgi:hypothetical protein
VSRDARGSDVIARSGGVVIIVRGARPRAVPVLARYHTRLLAAASSAGTALICGGADPGRRNLTNQLITNPKLAGERDQARQTLKDQPANRPAPGTLIVTGKGLAGKDSEEFFASDELGLTLIRPARKDEKQPRPFPNWLRQRVEAVIWTLKNQLGLERHGSRIPAGLWTRIVQRLLALNTVIWFNWMIDAPVKRSLIAYDHD